MMIPSEIYKVMRPMPVFKPEMRKANRELRKFQTRRVIKLSELRYVATEGVLNGSFFYRDKRGTWQNCSRDELLKKCPYGKAGDYCYMREPLIGEYGDVAYYRDDDAVIARHVLTGDPIPWRWKKNVLSGMFMPKEAARFMYQYELIRVERVQDITEDDAIKEGASLGRVLGYGRLGMKSHREGFFELWEAINAKRGFGLEANPWVWVLNYVPVEVHYG